MLFVLVSYLPVPDMIGEMKTKPTQMAARLLNEAGIQPDIILARASQPLDEPRKRKISIFCNVAPEDVISALDAKSIYEVPVNLAKENLGIRILGKFGMSSKKNDFGDWENLVEKISKVSEPIKIGIVGKYFESGKFILADSYISVIESIKHACWYHNRKPEIVWLSAEKYEDDPKALEELRQYDGIIVPGGFGTRGVEGKIKAIQFLRENNIPFFGLCLGMQLATIEFARNVCGLKKASSTEFIPDCQEPVIDVMNGQKDLLKEKKYGGTMRLGAYNCDLKPDTQAFRAYKTKTISERHRHRYELNNKYRPMLEQNGLVMAGVNPEKDLVEIVELKDHPFFVGVQFHPEFKSRPLNPQPLFREFVGAAIKGKNK